jgi:hypothetical protein
MWKKTDELAAVHGRSGEKMIIEVHRHMIPARYGRQTWLHKGNTRFQLSNGTPVHQLDDKRFCLERGEVLLRLL